MNNVANLTKKGHGGKLLAQEEKKLIKFFLRGPKVAVSKFLATLAPLQTLNLFKKLPENLQGDAFASFDTDYQMSLYRLTDTKSFVEIFSHMPAGARADFYKNLDGQEQLKLLPYLTKKIRENIIPLSSYLPQTAGSIMTTDFSTVLEDMTMKQAIQKLKEDAPSKKMIYYIYVVNANMCMIGFVSLKDLIMAEPNDLVVKYLHEKFIYGSIHEDQETVAQRIEKYSLVALPILNVDRQLVGIVSYETAMDIIRIEQTEDMERFVGIVSNEDTANYLDVSSFKHFKKRLAWILGLFITGIASTLIIHQHEHLLHQVTVLALYLPMITAAGGNTGSQAASVVIRALSVGQITLKDWLMVIFKETKIALLLAISLFCIAFPKIILISSYSMMVPYNIYIIAFKISIALSIQVVTSAIIGATLPLIAQYFNGDPAVVASPAITTLVDITGMIIYFAIAITILT